MNAGMKGKFITLEGIDGAGKSTQLRYIRQYLREANVDFIATREPGGTPVGEALRDLLLDPHTRGIRPQTELMLMFAARMEHLQRKIIPALQAGRSVLSERFTDATYAYQGGGRGLDAKLIEGLETLTQGDLRPDLVIYLDIPPQQGLARANRRAAADRFEREDLSFFHRVRQAYLRRAAAFPATHRAVDASRDSGHVREQIRRALDRLMRDGRE